MFSVPPLPPKGKGYKNNKLPYVWIKQKEKSWTTSFQVLSNQSCSTILYRINEQIKKRKTVWWGKFCLGTWGEKSAFCCILASRHQKYNWCGWVQLLRVEIILRFCLFGFFFQSIIGDSQRKFRKQVRAHKITKEPLDMQEQFIKHFNHSKL